MTEKTIQQFYIDIFKRLDIPYFHEHPRARKYQHKDFPDLLFIWGGQFHFREFGIKGRHNDRKCRQYDYMKKCKERAGDSLTIKLIFTLDAAGEDMKELGILR